MENKLYIHKGPFELESGEVLQELKIQYCSSGTLDAEGGNVVWFCHALTANADVEAWWPGLVGEGKLFNPKEHFILCANIIGSCYGSSGPTEINPQTGKPYYLTFPKVTMRDMARAHEVLAKGLGLKRIHTCVGGSLGGQQAIEWALLNPERIQHLILLATNACHSPWGIAFNESQRMAIYADPTWKDESPEAGVNGLRAARAVALLSYRSYETYGYTQKEDTCEKTDQFKAISYQQYQGDKLAKRFHCHSYLYLTWALDSHNVGRGRTNVEQALQRVQAHTLLIGISTDVLFPPVEQQYMSRYIPGAEYHEIESLYGHDGFLIEYEKIEKVVRHWQQRKGVLQP